MSDFSSKIVEIVEIENYDRKTFTFIPIMSVFEITSIISIRASQFQNMAVPNIEYTVDQEPEYIAMEELKQGKTPFLIKRTIGNYTEFWKVEDLELNTDLLPQI
jgi:DNA-directed RNA polymerase subunit K/omega